MYKDPLWQRLLYVKFTPVFRMLHDDKRNLFLWWLLFVSVGCYYFNEYWLSVMYLSVVLSAILFKLYISCGDNINPYKTMRVSNDSYLDRSQLVPTLYLRGKTPYANGFDYGIIMCEEILLLVRRFKTMINPKVPAWVLNSINEKLPPSIWNEISGMYEAINSIHPNAITYWDILTLQLIPEISNAMISAACTCYATYDKENNKKDVIFGRNMDWIPFASAQYTIIVDYDNHKYASLTMPGLIGCVTAWKSPHYVLAMNVVGVPYSYTTRPSLPSTLFNKHIMIQASTAAQAHEMASGGYQSTDTPYHLTIADATNVKSYSYHQSDFIHVRELQIDSSLSVLNWTYPDNDQGRFISKQRDDWIKEIEAREMSNTDKVSKIMEKCQSFQTIHAAVFYWVNKELYYDIAVSNGFAVDLL